MNSIQNISLKCIRPMILNLRNYTSTIVHLKNVKVGDKVPISILTTDNDPLIKEDSEYPEWLADVTKKELTLAELQRMWNINPDSLTLRELRRFKKQLTLNDIKEANSSIDKL